MVSLTKIQLVETNKQKAFTLIELLVVVAIIGILSSAGVVAYNGYTKSAKAKTAELNYTNINKALMFEFMKCELDSSAIVFNNHKCSNSNSPSINTISGFITNNLKMSKDIRFKKGANLNLIGKAEKSINNKSKSDLFALQPNDFLPI